jgi:hypothetical protein
MRLDPPGSSERGIRAVPVVESKRRRGRGQPILVGLAGIVDI